MKEYCNDPKLPYPDYHKCADCGYNSLGSNLVIRAGYGRFLECARCGGTMLPNWIVSAIFL